MQARSLALAPQPGTGPTAWHWPHSLALAPQPAQPLTPPAPLLPLQGALKVGDKVTAKVDYTRRAQIMPNHTFTHVLNYALRETLGTHVDQRGSIVLPDKLRFDFSNNGPVDTPKLEAIEAICRKALAASLPVYSREVPLAQAKEINGLRAVFGEVYPDPVRVVSVGVSTDDLLAQPKVGWLAAPAALAGCQECVVRLCAGLQVVAVHVLVAALALVRVYLGS
jgi:alanyl-tRNA synthetase